MEKYKSPNYYSDDFKDLVNQMLALKDEQRIKMDGILAHPWVQGETATKEEIIE